VEGAPKKIPKPTKKEEKVSMFSLRKKSNIPLPETVVAEKKKAKKPPINV